MDRQGGCGVLCNPCRPEANSYYCSQEISRGGVTALDPYRTIRTLVPMPEQGVEKQIENGSTPR